MESVFDWAEFALITPELIVLGGALLLLLFGAFRGPRATGGITLLSMIVMIAAAVYAWPSSGDGSITVFNDLIAIDNFTQFVKVMVLVSATLVLGMSYDWLMIGPHKKFEYPVLVLLSTAGMMVLVSANDLLTLYLGLELSSLALYVLAAYDRDNAVSSEAGVKYFVLGALSSGMLLFGASLVYGYTGTTNFSAMAELFSATEDAQASVAYGAIVGMVMLVVALCFKISAVPFHMWTPDVYQGAPTPVTMLFATAPKIAAMAIFIRLLMDPFSNMLPDWQNILAIVSVASMMVGAFGALTQTNIKRLLAYGSIGHIGYMLIGLAAGTPDGIKGVLVYFALYLFMSVGTFGFVLFMRRAGEQVEDISDLAGLSKTSPRGALFMLLMMFSMAGIPPLAGFFGKFFIFLSAIQSELYVLAVIGVLTSVIAAFYYLKIIKIMYFDEPVLGLERGVPLFSQAVLLICALVTALFFLYPAALLDAAQNAVGVFNNG